jgi:hypothetical protein
MLRLCVFGLFDVIGVAFMLYVLVNFHLDLKRSRGESMHRRRSQVERVSKMRDEFPAAYYTPAQNASTFTKTETTVAYGSSHVRRQLVF